MQVKFRQRVKVERTLKTIDLHVKCTDTMYATFRDENGEELLVVEEGPVPPFFPGNHYGEYLILKIDPATGQITNWNASPERVSDFMEEMLSEG